MASMHTNNLRELAYRADIDGLRSVAVLSVLIFHAFPNVLPGGFIGVDIFFVISGYLITKIIINGLAENNFYFREFWSRRIIRILPATLLVLMCTLVFGMLFFYDDERNQLFKHLVGALLFISNITYSNEAGYFDSVSDTKPLLHFWSLAIEEQFYIIWPIFLIIFYKYYPKKIIYLISALIFLSFCWNLYQLKQSTAIAYYSPLCRAWELMIGAWLAAKQIPTQDARRATILSSCGVALIIVGLLMTSATSRHPGPITLLPVLGTFLILLSGPAAQFNRTVLSNGILVEVGKISFPLYLWHWPLLSILAIYTAGAPSALQSALALFTSLIFAWLTYKFIEQPIRKRANKLKTAALLGLALFGMLLLVGGMHRWGNFTFNSLALDSAAMSYYEKYSNEPVGAWLTKFESEFRHECNYFQIDAYYRGQVTNVPKPEIDESCYRLDSTKEARMLIWGDSHAQMLHSGFRKNLPSQWQLLQVASSGCMANANVKRASSVDYCAQSNWRALETIRETQPQVVVIAQSQNHSVSEMNHIHNEVTRLGVRTVIFLGPSPHWKSDLPKIVVRQLWPEIPERTKIGLDVRFIKLNETVKASFIESNNKKYIDVIGVFCNTGGCLVHLGLEYDYELTSWDYGHLTAAASDYLARQIIPKIIH